MLTQHAPKESFDWLFLMQHYGVPTRLLDWTESPLVALYFALNDETVKDRNAALWALRPTELNKNANIIDADEKYYVPSFDDAELKSYSIESLRNSNRVQLLPVATIATRNNARIQAQLGVFTVHHSDERSIDAVGDQSHIFKYLIPDADRAAFAAELKLLGINRFSIFPEMSSIGLVIKDALL
jgi:hypothetical protein